MRTQISFLFGPEATLPAPGAGYRILADRRGASVADVPAGAALLLDAAAFLALPAPTAAALYVECPPGLGGAPGAELRAAFTRHAGAAVPVTGDAAFALSLAEAGLVRSVVLKSCEAGGAGSAETAGVLLDNLLPKFVALGVELVIWGGVATPEAAAAFLATGAAGVVVEHAHWLLDGMGLAESLRGKLAKLRPGSQACVNALGALSWRFFDRGNSQAVRTLAELAASDPQAAAERAGAESVPLHTSTLASAELTPMGADAAFAADFTRRFGADAGPALSRFAAETARLVSGAARAMRRFLSGPAAHELGCSLPVIQGGMSWISDSPAFARAVADSGALPTLAVGMRTPELLDRDFGALAETMQGRSYALNVLVLDENPHREGQLAWLRAHRPPFVAVAAGSPAFAGALAREGFGVIYLAADIELARLALSSGVRFVVLEGCEAGGHVGRQTLLELAQAAVCLRRDEPELFREARVVLAGGICGGKSALRAALLGADAVQLGTAYLTCREIVETGALGAVYQQEILNAGLGSTRISGESVGLRVRALDTPKVRAISELERRRAAGGLDEAAFRHELEALSVGSLLVAARGVRKPGGETLDSETCRAEGQFMSGAVAANLPGLTSLAELHASIAAAAPAPPASGPAEAATAPRERIAITGMALANSLGLDTDAVIEASLAGKSGLATVPRARWDHAVYHRPGQFLPGASYTDVGAFMETDFPRKSLGVSPQDYRTMSMSTRLTLLLARRAVEASGLAGSLVPGSRVAVLTSQNSAEAASTVRGQMFTTYADELGEIAWRAAQLTPEQRAAVAREVAAEGATIDDTSLIGRLNCTASGHVCNMYGFSGPSYSVGAACASSLIALYNAVLLLRAGVIDAAVVGGGEELITPTHYLEFSSLRALAGSGGRARTPREHSRPFDRDRDGFVLGEGGAVLVIERESVARERGADMHAFITGVGACTNHQGIVESVAESQLAALGAAQADCGYGLEAVDLVECHGTGTPQGDREEVRALAALSPGGGKSTVLASFKSQVGHTLGASGLSSLIRGVGAMRRGFYPPTLNFSTPDPAMGLDAAGFRILGHAEPWEAPAGRARRMQVNAFGFGGACVVVQLEAPADAPDIAFTPPEPEPAEQPSGLRFCRAELGGRSLRLGLAGAGAGAAELLRAHADEGLPASGLARLARKGVFLEGEGEPAGPLACIFSGQGAFYPGMGRDIARAHPAAARALDRLAACADFDLKELLFRADEERLRQTRWQQPVLFAFEHMLHGLLAEHGLRPAALAGHSLGEFSALCAAGVLSPEDAFRVVDARARLMAKAADLAPEPTAMAAVGLPVDVLQWKLAKYPGLAVTNYNTPRQVVVGGPEDQVSALVAELKDKGHQATRLAVSMAFHSPVMRVIREEFAALLSGVAFRAPELPVVSNVERGPFPADPARIREIMVAHLETPVHWTHNVYFLWSELGVRRFVEVGPAAVLGNLVRDTCEEARTLRTASKDGELAACNQALAALWAWGELSPPEVPEDFAVTPPAPAHGTGASAGASATQGNAATPNKTGEASVMERTIRIVMEATGYERDEIEPDMDLRQDLAIRSSRLPVIMDAAERAFGLSFRMEDFIGVRTIRQMSELVEHLLTEAGRTAAAPAHAATPNKTDEVGDATPNESGEAGDEVGVGRFTAAETPFAATGALDVAELSGKAAALRLVGGSGLAAALASGLSTGCGVASEAAELYAALAGQPAGLVLAVDAAGLSQEQVAGHLEAAFLRLKEFVTSPARRFCALAMTEAPHGTPARAFYEGVLGMLLTLAQEYGSVRWRALRVTEGTDVGAALALSLAEAGPVERIVRAGGVFTPRFEPAALPQGPAEGRAALRPGDVLVASGGARGVTFRLLEALAPLGLHIVLLGRSAPGKAEAAAVTRLERLGSRAEYRPCDVGEAAAVAAALVGLPRVDALLHGAGVLRDSFLSLMSAEDFRAVCRVKLGGLENLLAAMLPRGLRFAAGLSSIAAWQGNVGQANYCAANRAMASLLAGLPSRGVAARALWLPPVSGVGMADNAELRELMERKGMGRAFVHVDELAPLFAREAGCASEGAESVLFSRHRMPVEAVLPEREPAGDAEAGRALPVDGLPMLDSALLTRLSPPEALCLRRVSHARDPWLPDHRPYKSLPTPLFSAVMAVESFCEAAVALMPQLRVAGLADLRFLGMLPCGPEAERSLRIAAAQRPQEGPCLRVDLSLDSEDVSPKGRALGRFSTNYEGSVLLSGLPAELPVWLRLGPEADGPGLDAAALLAMYEADTAQTGRYRVIDAVDSVGAGGVRGGMRARPDERIPGGGALLTSPYVLEALLQLTFIHRKLTDKALEFLPVGIASLGWTRLCTEGEPLSLEARLLEDGPRMQLWDACALDASGAPVLALRGLVMQAMG